MAKQIYMDRGFEKHAADTDKSLKASAPLQAVQVKSRANAFADGTAQFFGSDILGHLGTAQAMPEPVQAKMESALGADFSGVELYESALVADGGAEAAASGKKIAFAPGKMDFDSSAGLELLGHELSHVASQSRGEVNGHGFVNNSVLEHKADLDGKKASGFSAFDSTSGETLSPMSAGLGGSVSAAAPVQAKKAQNRGDLMRQDAAKKPDSRLVQQVMDATPGAMDVQKLNVMLDYARAKDAYRFKGGEPDASEEAAYQQMIGEMTPEFAEMLYGQESLQAHRVLDVSRGWGDMDADEGAYRAKYSEEADRLRAFQSLVNDLNYSDNHAAARAYDHVQGDYNRKGINGDMINAFEMIQRDNSQNTWAQKNADAANAVESESFHRNISFRRDRDARMDTRLEEAQHPVAAFFKKLFGGRR